MARPGVTYKEVAKAASQLLGEGKNPTIERVRLILGTGSSTTLANHLKQWKDHQSVTDTASLQENLPEELVGSIKDLWVRLVNHATQQVAFIQNNHEQTLAQLQQELQKYKNNNQRWQQLYNQWLIQKTQLAHDNLAQQQAFESLQKDYYSLQKKLQLVQQEKEKRITELQC